MTRSDSKHDEGNAAARRRDGRLIARKQEPFAGRNPNPSSPRRRHRARRAEFDAATSRALARVPSVDSCPVAPMTVRVTDVYRREHGERKIVHWLRRPGTCR
jgi:hypothetical protein